MYTYRAQKFRSRLGVSLKIYVCLRVTVSIGDPSPVDSTAVSPIDRESDESDESDQTFLKTFIYNRRAVCIYLFFTNIVSFPRYTKSYSSHFFRESAGTAAFPIRTHTVFSLIVRYRGQPASKRYRIVASPNLWHRVSAATVALPRTVQYSTAQQLR